MGVFLIGIVLLVLCFVFYKIYNNSYSDAPIYISVTCGMLSIIILAISIIGGISCQVTKQKHYEKALYEKSVLEYRLENEINTVGNEMLYNDIVEFNQGLKETKYYSKSFWFNWYNNDLVADIDYIKIDDIVPKDLG